MNSALAHVEGTAAWLGDVHGCWERVARLLESLGWLDGDGHYHPPAGSALVQVGDLLDRGQPPTALPLLASARGRSWVLQQLELGGADPLRTELVPPASVGEAPVTLVALVEGRLPWPTELLAEERAALCGALDVLTTLRLFMRLQQQAATAGASLTVLLGNHEVDLLSGRWIYFSRQKAHLLALLGVPPATVAGPLANRGWPASAPPASASASAELAWLSGLPLLAVGGGVLAVHGGPTRRLAQSFELLGVHDLAGLAGLLEQARTSGFAHPLLAEHESLLSPDAPEDDAVQDPWLAARLLELAGASTLAVGHSPFLHFPKQRWVQLEQPEVRRQVERPALLGPGGTLLKLDTNLKRGGPAWLVLAAGDGQDGPRFVARREDGVGEPLGRWKLATAGGPTEPGEQPWPGDDGGASLPGPPPSGADGARLAALQRTLVDLGERGQPELARELGQALEQLLHCGLTDLAPLESVWRQLVVDPGGPSRQRLAALVQQVLRRRDELAAALSRRLVREAAGQWLVFAPPPQEQCVAGLLLQLAPAAAAQVLAGERTAAVGGVCAGVYLAGPEGPRLRLLPLGRGGGPTPGVLELPLSAWPPSGAELAALTAGPPPLLAAGEPGRVASPTPLVVFTEAAATADDGAPQAGPLVDGETGARVRRWLAGNSRHVPGWPTGQAVPSSALQLRALLDRQDPSRALTGRYRVQLGDGPAWEALLLPDGAVLPVNTALSDPAARWALADPPQGAAAPPDHARYLLRYLSGDPVVLYTAVSEQVEWLLRLGETDALGLRDAERPRWQRGRYLFCSPLAQVADYFFHKERTLRFAVPRDRLVSALDAGLVNVNLFASDRGEPLDPGATFGEPDLALEVVALDAAGIRWLMGFLRDGEAG